MKRPDAIAVALDGALCDTRPLWEGWLEASTAVLGVDPRGLPPDRAEAAAELDRRGAGNWRTLLARWAEERAPVYVRRDAKVSATLGALAAAGTRIGVYTDGPEPLARVALAHLGLERRIAALEAGASARERLVALLGRGTTVVETREALLGLGART